MCTHIVKLDTLATHWVSYALCGQCITVDAAHEATCSGDWPSGVRFIPHWR